MNSLLIQYSYLQMLDFMTTVAFLVTGVPEGNPFVRFAILHASHPLSGLLLVKLVGVALGVYCWRYGRERLLSRMNMLFAVVVVWNMVALIVGSVRGVG